MGYTNIEGVATEWDASEPVRERLRNGGGLLSKNPASQDISTCLSNNGLLAPLLARMAANPKREVPIVDALKDELEELVKKCKRGVDTDGIDIPKSAWALRKLCGFIKMKARRKEVSTVTWLQNNKLCSCFHFRIQSTTFHFDINMHV